MRCTFVSNLGECRLDAELSASDGTVLAILFEDSAGWHLEWINAGQSSISRKFIEQVKVDMQQYVHRTGLQAPEGLTMGELALWLLRKEDRPAMGVPYAQNMTTVAPSRDEPTVLPEESPGCLRRLLARLR